MGYRLAVWSLPDGRREVIAMYITLSDFIQMSLLIIAVITLCKKND